MYEVTITTKNGTRQRFRCTSEKLEAFQLWLQGVDYSMGGYSLPGQPFGNSVTVSKVFMFDTGVVLRDSLETAGWEELVEQINAPARTQFEFTDTEAAAA